MSPKTASPPPAGRRRMVKWSLIGVAVLLTVYTLTGFLAVPWMIKSYGARRLGEVLGRPVHVARAAFNPYTFALRIEGLTITEAGGSPLISLAELYIDLDLAASLGATPTIHQLHLGGPEVHVTRLADGTLNLARLLATPRDRSPAQDTPAKRPRFRLALAAIDQGRVVFRDEAAGGFEATISPINATVANLSSDAGRAADYDLTLSTEAGETLRLNGHLTLADLAVQGRLALAGVPLAKYAPYYRDHVGFRRVQGRLDTTLAYDFAEGRTRVDQLDVTLSELNLENPATRQTVLALPRLTVRGGQADTGTRAVTVAQIGIEGLSVTARRERDGTIDLAGLLAPPSNAAAVAKTGTPAPAPAPAGATPSWTVAVQSAVLAAGPLRFEDAAAVQPVQVFLESLGVRVGELTAGADGVRIGEVAVELQNLALRDPADEAILVELPRLTLSGGKIDAVDHTAVAARLDVSGTRINARRQADGTVNLAGLFAVPPGPAGQGDRPHDAGARVPWTLALDTLALADHSLRFEDRVPSSPVTLVIDQLGLDIQPFSTAPDAAPRIDLSCRVNQTGALSVSGPVALEPLSADLDLKIQDLPIQPFQPYFQDRVHLIVTDGRMGANGRLRVALPNGASPRIAYQGTAAITRFAAVDKRYARDFLRWQSLFVEGADITTAPMQVKVGRVALSDYYARLSVNADGTVNVATILGADPDPAATASGGAKTDSAAAAAVIQPVPAAPGSPPVPVQVDEITLQGGQVDFSDYLARPNFETRMFKLGGRISGLSSEPGSRADVLIQGALENHSPLEISGRFNPLTREKYTDLKLTFRNIELSPFSPYSGKYLGYTLAKGKLTLELNYQIAERRLKAANHIYFDALTLGEPVDSPEATNLPIKLALALLTDRQGRIELDVPVQGNLDDPQFSIFGIVVKALFNLLTKIITAPFDALASMFSGQVVTHVGFAPARADLDEEARSAVAKLTEALYKRPALRLEIEGSADATSDGPAIRQQRLDELIRAAKLKALTRAGRSGVRLTDLRVEPEEFETYLALAYAAADFAKPRDAAGREKILPPEEMQKLLYTQIPVADDDLRRLAQARANAVKDQLLSDERLKDDQVFLVEPKVEKAGQGDPARQVRFTLK